MGRKRSKQAPRSLPDSKRSSHRHERSNSRTPRHRRRTLQSLRNNTRARRPRARDDITHNPTRARLVRDARSLDRRRRYAGDVCGVHLGGGARDGVVADGEGVGRVQRRAGARAENFGEGRRSVILHAETRARHRLDALAHARVGNRRITRRRNRLNSVRIHRHRTILGRRGRDSDRARDSTRDELAERREDNDGLVDRRKAVCEGGCACVDADGAGLTCGGDERCFRDGVDVYPGGGKRVLLGFGGGAGERLGEDGGAVDFDGDGGRFGDGNGDGRAEDERVGGGIGDGHGDCGGGGVGDVCGRGGGEGIVDRGGSGDRDGDCGGEGHWDCDYDTFAESELIGRD